MGKSFELLGMMAFQTFLALIIGAALLGSSKEEIAGKLTPANIERFVHEMNDVMNGEKDNMDIYQITKYLSKHISQKGTYKTNMTYSYDMFDPQSEQSTMGRKEYIATVLASLGKIEAHETSLRLENISISDDGKKATIIVSSYEEGRMPVPFFNDSDKTIPMTGTSYCEQTLALTSENIIELTGATCKTDIGFITEE